LYRAPQFGQSKGVDAGLVAMAAPDKALRPRHAAEGPMLMIAAHWAG